MRLIQRRDAVGGEVHVGVCPLLPRHDLAAEPLGQADVEDVATIADLEIGDCGDRIVEGREGNEQVVGVAARRAGEQTRSKARIDLPRFRPTAAAVSRARAGGAHEQRRQERLAVVARGVELPLRGVAAQGAGCQLRCRPNRAIGKANAVDRRVLGAGLAGDRQPVVGAPQIQN